MAEPKADKAGDTGTPAPEETLQNGTPTEAPSAALVQAVPDDGVSEFIYMKHPQVESVAGPIRRESFEALWRHKGWEITSTPAVEIPV